MRWFTCGRVLALAAAAVMAAPSQLCAADVHLPVGARQTPATAVADIALGMDGLLTGQAMSMQGQPLAGETVVISDGRQHLSTTTDAKGQFTFTGLRGGAYTVYTSQQTHTCRAWKDGTAPPSATRGLMIVHGNETVLGQNRWERTMGRGTNCGAQVDCGDQVGCGTPVMGGAFAGARDALRNPLVIGGIVAAAVAIPVAIHNSNDDDPAS
jgi:hypothetical protein